MGYYRSFVREYTSMGSGGEYVEGYCYLHWVDVLIANGLDLDVLNYVSLGPYPRITEVLAIMYARVDVDIAIPTPTIVGPGIFHLSRQSRHMPLSNVMMLFLGSNARIGGLDMDMCVARSNRMRQIQGIADAAGTSLTAVLQEGAMEMIRRDVRENTSIVRDAIVNGYASNERSKNRFTVPFVLVNTELATLQQDYPGLNVVSRGTENHPHGIAASGRLCAEEWVLRQLKYSPNQFVIGGGVVVIDVGSNWARHALAGRNNIHGCVPILDVRDSARETDRQRMVADAVRASRFSAQMAERYMDGDLRCRKSYRTNKECDRCYVKADALIMIHSAYDINKEKMGMMFDDHDIKVAWVVIHFDSRVFYLKRFTMNDINCTVTVADGRISFMFVGDPCLSYEHDYKDYIELVTQNVLVTESGACFLIERMAYKGGSMFIKYTRCFEKPESNDIRLLSCHYPVISNNCIVSTWEYDDSYFLDSKINRAGCHKRLRRRFLEVPKFLFNMLEQHCLRSGDRSFNINEIYSVATSYNTRMTINGQDIRARDSVDAGLLFEVVIAVYCLSFRQRYRGGKVVEAFANQEKLKRTQSRLGFCDVVQYLYGKKAGDLFPSLSDLWNGFVDRVCESKIKRDDIEVMKLDTIQCLEMHEFLTIHARYDPSAYVTLRQKMDCVAVREIDVDAELKDTIEKALAEDEKLSPPGFAVPTGPAVTRTIADYSKCRFTDKMLADRRQICSVATGKNDRNKCKNMLYRITQSIPSDANVTSDYHKKMIKNMKDEKNFKCDYTGTINVLGDGNCIYWAIREHVPCFSKIDSSLVRQLIAFYAEKVPKDGTSVLPRILDDVAKDARNLRLQGSTDTLNVACDMFRANLCIHTDMRLGNKTCPIVTRIYGSRNDREKTMHIHLVFPNCDPNAIGHALVGTKCGRHEDFTVELFECLRAFATQRTELEALNVSAHIVASIISVVGGGVTSWTSDYDDVMRKIGIARDDAAVLVDNGDERMQRVVFLNDLPKDPVRGVTYVCRLSDITVINDGKCRRFESVIVVPDGSVRCGVGVYVIFSCWTADEKFAFDYPAVVACWLEDFLREGDMWVDCLKDEDVGYYGLLMKAKLMVGGCFCAEVDDDQETLLGDTEFKTECCQYNEWLAGRCKCFRGVLGIIGRNLRRSWYGVIHLLSACGSPCWLEVKDAAKEDDEKAIARLIEKAKEAPEEEYDRREQRDQNRRKIYRDQVLDWLLRQRYMESKEPGVLKQGRSYRLFDAPLAAVTKLDKRSAPPGENFSDGVRKTIANGCKNFKKKVKLLACDQFGDVEIEPIDSTHSHVATIYGVTGTRRVVSDGFRPTDRGAKRIDDTVKIGYKVGKMNVRTYGRDVGCYMLKNTRGDTECFTVAGNVYFLPISPNADKVDFSAQTDFPDDDGKCDVATDALLFGDRRSEAERGVASVDEKVSVACVKRKCESVVEDECERKNVSENCVNAKVNVVCVKKDESVVKDECVKKDVSKGTNDVACGSDLPIDDRRLPKGVPLFSDAALNKLDKVMLYQNYMEERYVEECGVPKNVLSDIYDANSNVDESIYEPKTPSILMDDAREGSDMDVSIEGSICGDGILHEEVEAEVPHEADTQKGIDIHHEDVFSHLFDSVKTEMNINFTNAQMNAILDGSAVKPVAPTGGHATRESRSSERTMVKDAAIDDMGPDTSPVRATVHVETEHIHDPYDFVGERNGGAKKKRGEQDKRKTPDGGPNAKTVQTTKVAPAEPVVGLKSEKAVSKTPVEKMEVDGAESDLLVAKDGTGKRKVDARRVRSPLPKKEKTGGMSEVGLAECFKQSRVNKPVATDSTARVVSYICFPSAPVCFAFYDLRTKKDHGDKYVISRGLRKMEHFNASGVTERELLDKGYMYVREVEGRDVFVRFVDGRVIYLLPVAATGSKYLRAMLDDYEEHFGHGGTFGYDIANVNVLSLVELVVETQEKHHWIFYQYRTTAYNSLEDLAKPAPFDEPPVFPALGEDMMNIKRTPTYCIERDSDNYWRNAFIEYRHTLRIQEDVNAIEYRRVLEGLYNVDPNTSASTADMCSKAGYNIYDNVNGCFLFEADKDKAYMSGYASSGYVDWSPHLSRFETKDRYILVTKKTEIMIAYKTYQALSRIDIRDVRMPKVHAVNGVPGCGKTYCILNAHKPGIDLVVTSTREGAEDLRRRVTKIAKLPDKVLRENYRTAASLLLNNGDNTYDTVFVDEALMLHAGAVAAIAAITKCRLLVLVGDRNQIPYIDREKLFVQKFSFVSNAVSASQELLCTHRCPIDVAAALESVYPGIYTRNNVVDSISIKRYSGATIRKDLERTLYMVHRQADKQSLRSNGYGVGEGSKVMTIHEAQGLSWENVVMIRTLTKAIDIYDSEPHAVVALSRHTKSFVYYTDASDALTRLCRRIPENMTRVVMRNEERRNAGISTEGIDLGLYERRVGGPSFVIRANAVMLGNSTYIDRFEKDKAVQFDDRNFFVMNDDATCIYAPPGAGKTTFLRENRLYDRVVDTDYVDTDCGADYVLTNRHDLCGHYKTVVALIYDRTTWTKMLEGKGLRVKKGWYDDMLRNTANAKHRLVMEPGRYVSDVIGYVEERLRCGGEFMQDVAYDRYAQKGVDGRFLTGLPTYEHLPMRPVVISSNIREDAHPGSARPKRDGDIAYLQAYYDDKVPGASLHVLRHDQDIVEYSDIALNIDRIGIVGIRGPYTHSKFDKLQPRLRTSMYQTRRASQRDSLLGAMKRNLNAPKLTNDLSPYAVGNLLYNNFVLSAIDAKDQATYDSFRREKIELNEEMVSEWLLKQKPSVARQVDTGEPLHLRPYNRFGFMCKALVKPSMEADSVWKYPGVQTIAYSRKDVNAIFCPIFQVMRERLLSVMKVKFMMFTDMSVQEFDHLVNTRINFFLLKKLRSIECDMSKYDKAQGEALAEFERMLYMALGMPDWLVDIWMESHRFSIISDRTNGVKFTTEYQRRSGDASTFFGNTVVLIAMLLACYDHEDIEFALFSGDDSVIWLKTWTTYDPSQRMADMFNMECKLLRSYETPYFCSKFLIMGGDRMHVMPDLVKLITKFGRCDMANWEHVEDYRISTQDVVSVMENEVIWYEFGRALTERYGGFIDDVTKVMRVLLSLVGDEHSFKGLFEEPLGAKLCYDPSRREI